jgi:hypothetical protein
LHRVEGRFRELSHHAESGPRQQIRGGNAPRDRGRLLERFTCGGGLTDCHLCPRQRQHELASTTRVNRWLEREDIQRSPELVGRLLVREHAERPLSCASRVLDCLARLSVGRSLHKVVRELRQPRLEVGTKMILDRLAHQAVQAKPSRGAETVVEDVANQRVDKGVPGDRAGQLDHEPGGHCFLQQADGPVSGRWRHRRQEDIESELAPDYGCRCQELGACDGQMPNAALDRRPHAVGGRKHLPFFPQEEQSRQLPHEQRIASGCPVCRLEQVELRQPPGRDHEEAADFGLAEPTKHQANALARQLPEQGC